MARMTIAALFLVVVVSVVVINAHASLVVHTQYGAIEGFSTDGTEQWLGVPFASPPIGDYRFTAPHAPHKWDHVLQTKRFAKACVQGADALPIDDQSEDCLFLNVFRPANTTEDSKLPVKVWIYGGAFTSGATSLYPAGALSAATNAVVVSIAYRVGPLAWMALEALRAESKTLNYGLQDQQFGLKWVHDNIRAFGGDPDRVMIFGESAGGCSVAFHLIMKNSWPFYKKAVIESGGYWSYPTLEVAINVSTEYALAHGCAGGNILKCLRALPARQIASFDRIQPCIDGVQVHENVLVAFKNGNINRKIDLLIGTNAQEGNYFAWEDGINEFNVTDFHFTQEQYLQLVAEKAFPYGKIVLPWYEADTTKYGYWQTLSKLLADGYINCGNSYVADRSAQLGMNVYRYLFTHITTQGKEAFLNATHTAEIPFVFNNPTYFGDQTFVPADKQIADAIVSYWNTFHLTGNPNYKGGFNWPKYSGKANQNDTLVIDNKMAYISNYDVEKCSKWLTLWT